VREYALCAGKFFVTTRSSDRHARRLRDAQHFDDSVSVESGGLLGTYQRIELLA
jgi:hypothetical protein